MDIMIRGLAFGAAALCAALMGFALPPGGFYLGSLLGTRQAVAAAPAPLVGGPGMLATSPVAWIVAAVFAWRVGSACLRGPAALRDSARLWSPHAATSVIGVAF